MPLDTQTIAICALIVSGANLLLNWNIYRNNKTKILDERITTLKGHFDGHATRIAKIESSCKFHPNHHDLGELQNKINGVDRNVSALGGKMEGIEDNLRLILNRLTERGKQ